MLLMMIWLVLIATAYPGKAARILALAHYHGRSNFVIFDAVLQGLSARGHQITLVSHFPPSHNVSIHISIAGTLQSLVDTADVDTFDYSTLQIPGTLKFFGPWSMEWCQKVLEHEKVQKLIHSQDLKFDLVITQIQGTDCLLGFAHKFSTPVVSVMANVIYPWAGARIGNPEYPSFVANPFFPAMAPMSTWERALNMGVTILLQSCHDLVSYFAMDPLARKHFGDFLPSMRQLARDRTALLLVNSHWSMNQPRPSVPAFVEIGGIHIKKPQPLPKWGSSLARLHIRDDAGLRGHIYIGGSTILRAVRHSDSGSLGSAGRYDLENHNPLSLLLALLSAQHKHSLLAMDGWDLKDFFSGSEHGIVYFSLGSMVRLNSFQKEKLEALLQAFAELPQRVLIKGKIQSVPIPKNVLVRSWLPQMDILAHPAVRVFVCHGGLLGMQEAVHFGVPVVVMPFYADQRQSGSMAVQKGFGVQLDFQTLTKSSIMNAINTVVHNPSYKENALSASVKFRDRIHSPSEMATYWIEYVLHNGNVLSRGVITDLPWYSNLLLDVLATILFCVVVLVFFIYGVIKLLVKVLRYPFRANS